VTGEPVHAALTTLGWSLWRSLVDGADPGSGKGGWFVTGSAGQGGRKSLSAVQGKNQEEDWSTLSASRLMIFFNYTTMTYSKIRKRILCQLSVTDSDGMREGRLFVHNEPLLDPPLRGILLFTLQYID